MSDIARKRREIVKRYTDHLDSLKWSGMEYDEAEVRRAWQAELDELENDNAS